MQDKNLTSLCAKLILKVILRSFEGRCDEVEGLVRFSF